jgi:hypothetical protein
MSNPSAPFSKLKERRLRKKCPDKQISAQDLWPSIRLHGIKLIIRLYGIKLQDIRLLNIKPLGTSPKASCPMTLGSSTSGALEEICSCQAKWQIQALQKAA